MKPAVLEKLIEMADRNRDLAATRRARADRLPMLYAQGSDHNTEDDD